MSYMIESAGLCLKIMPTTSSISRQELAGYAVNTSYLPAYTGGDSKELISHVEGWGKRLKELFPYILPLDELVSDEQWWNMFAFENSEHDAGQLRNWVLAVHNHDPFLLKEKSPKPVRLAMQYGPMPSWWYPITQDDTGYHEIPVRRPMVGKWEHIIIQNK